MSEKKSKKSSDFLAKHLSFGILTNAAVGPLGFRAEFDTDPRVLDGDNARPSRIVSNQKEDEVQELPLPVPGSSTFAISEIEPGNRPKEDDIGPTRQKSEPGMALRGVFGTPSTPGADVTKEAADGFGPLKTLLRSISVVSPKHDGSATIRNKVEVLLSRIASLDALFAARPGDIAELRRRDELIHKIDGIEGQLRSLGGVPGQQQFIDQIQVNEGTPRLLEDMQEAILNYQMAQPVIISDQGLDTINLAEAAILNNVHCAQQAEYRHGDRNGCLKGTRTVILDEIELWIRDFGKPPVYWLNGLAGTGKTTIAQTIAERTFADRQLGASFFCSRDFEDRSNLKFIFPTLAVQLARRHTEFRSTFVQLVQSDPEIIHESLYGQMKKLIVHPLMKSAISTVIVIDALDECKDEETASAILSVLGQFVTQIPKVKFFVTGRPEPRIRKGFRLPLLVDATDVFVLHEVESSQVNSDIRLFFGCNFSELKSHRRGLDDWPTEEQLELLCERAAGLFVYAMATVKFICQRNSNPKRQLDRILQSPESSLLEGRTKLKANTTLDLLYLSILQEAFGEDDPENDPRVRSVFGAVILATNPLSPSTIAALLGFEPGDVFPLLSSVHSLLVLREDVNRPVQPFHMSFPDFIVNPSRCADSRFCISPPEQHTELLLGCLELMNQRLERNMCELPDWVTNAEVVDLKERTERHIDQALQYACRSWHKHLVDTIPAHIIPVLHRFLEDKFLFWLEALSALGAVREAVDALDTTTNRLDVRNTLLFALFRKLTQAGFQASPTLDLVSDYIHFVITFFEVISTSQPHIYHSALPLSPQTSIVRRLYQRYARPLVRVAQGLPISWEPTVATMYHGGHGHKAAWSPCSKFVAVAKGDTVQILDATTLRQLNAFEFPTVDRPAADRGVSWHSFSPDGRVLTQLGYENLTSWNLQTGGPIGIIPAASWVLDRTPYVPPTYSMDGNRVAIAGYSFIAIHDHPSNTHTHTCHIPGGDLINPAWTHGECLRFATVKQRTITIWETHFMLVHAPKEVETLPGPDEDFDGRHSLFLPTLSRLAFSVANTIFIWDAKISKILLESRPMPTSGYTEGSEPSVSHGQSSFSSDGRLFACVVNSAEAFVWKESPTGYSLHQKLAFPAGIFEGPLLSPNGESIIVSGFGAFYLWPTKEQIFSPSTTPTIECSFVIEFSPDGTLMAFVRERDNVVRILNLQSGDLLAVVDVGVAVGCLGVAGNTMVVVGGEKIVTWILPVSNCTAKAEAYISSSVQTTMFDPSRAPEYRSTRRCASISPDLSRTATLSLDHGLEIYNTSTGRPSARIRTSLPPNEPRFTQDGREVWTVDDSYSTNGWKLVEDNESGTTKYWSLGSTACPPDVFPWRSHCGYEVADEEWVLSPAKKRLLWLPHHWRSDELDRRWKGRILVLGHSELPDVVVLEFPE